MIAVECAGLTKSFGRVPALDGVDLVVAAGELTALLGPSGCGKSTLLRLIAGFERADRGEVTVSGRTVSGTAVHVPPERRNVGIVPQDQALFPHLDVAANVAYGLGRGRDRGTAGKSLRVAEMLELCGLSGLGSRMPHELSGGQQQRVALARALAPGPSVVLLDEPFANLDARLRIDLRAEIATVLRSAGQTAVLVTHDQDEALSMADTVAVMREGRIVQVGRPDDVYHRPADLWLAGFVGRANILDGRVVAPGWVECAVGRVAIAPAGGPETGAVSVVVRPEQLHLADAGSGGVGGVVEHREYYGHDALVRVALGDGTRLWARTRTDPLPAVDSEVWLTCRGESVCFPDGDSEAVPATPR